MTTHKNSNQVRPTHPKHIAMVIANPAFSTTTGWPVGFWWSELTHPYFLFTEAGYTIDIFSPDGGKCEADAMSNPDDPSQWQAEDLITRGFLHDPQLMQFIEQTKMVNEIDSNAYDAIVVAGGQSPMFTYEKATTLQQKVVEFYEQGKVVGILCHGVALLRYTMLSTGAPLVQGKTVTGFANVEEDFSDHAMWNMNLLPQGTHVMPWRIEDELKKLGANYIQAGLWKPFAIRDGNLVTGQQNFSGAETARVIMEALGL